MSQPIDKICNRIKKGMQARNMQAIDICNATGISKASMSQYINGVVQPKNDRVYSIAKALDVSEAWLLGYDVCMDRENKLSIDNAHLVAQIRNDTRMTEALKKYFLLSDSEKDKILSVLETLLF